MLRVGITGGIGSGKSLVCQIIGAMGYPVFYSDLQARKLTQADPDTMKGIRVLFGDDIYVNGQLNRKRVAELCFTNKQLLESLNELIHPKVFNLFGSWVESNSDNGVVFMEVAILFESGADHYLDSVVVVAAPEPVRIERVIARDQVSPQSVSDRIRNQLPEAELIAKANHVIHNDGDRLIVPQIIRVLETLH